MDPASGHVNPPLQMASPVRPEGTAEPDDGFHFNRPFGTKEATTPDSKLDLSMNLVWWQAFCLP